MNIEGHRRKQEMSPQYYEKMDDLRKNHYVWLKSLVNKVESTEMPDKRIFVLIEALMSHIDFISDDLSDRTKELSGQTNFLWAYTRILADAVVFLGNKIEKIEPVTEQINKFEVQLKELLSKKEQIDTRIKERADQIQKQKEKIEKDMPGIA